MTSPHSVATLVMPEETGFYEESEHDQREAEEFPVPSAQTYLTRVGNPGLQHALDVFDEACAPSVELLRSVMARALVEARGHIAVDAPRFLHDELRPWGNAVLWLDGRCEYLTGFLSDAATPRPVVFANTWTQLFDQDHAEVDEDEVTGHDDAVAVIEALAAKLGLPVKDVLKAAGIKKSSFYSWKQPDAPRPRVASQGRLWSLAQFVEDLTASTDGNVRQWLLASDARRDRLVHGQFDRLVAEATAEGSTARVRTEPAWAATFGVGAEHETSPDHQSDSDRHLPPFTRATPAQVPVSPNRRRE